jgi:hypothetical protein
MNGAKIVFATLSSSGSRVLDGKQFDVLIIDEATQVCYESLIRVANVVMTRLKNDFRKRCLYLNIKYMAYHRKF